jgi:pilus assembly protein CpaB
MNPRIIVLVLVAGVAAVGAMFAAQSWLTSQREALEGSVQPTEKVTAVRVMVAATDLPAGSIVGPSSLRWQAWPDDTLDENYVREGALPIESFTGGVVRTGVTAGEPVTENRLVRPGDQGFLAAVLSPGMRAITVSVNATTGISGFVFPGDRVDLILTHTIGSNAASGRERVASETVMTDVRVLGIDQSTNDQDGLPVVAKTVTLEVKPKHSEVVTLLAELGKLSLSLRSLQPAENALIAESGAEDGADIETESGTGGGPTLQATQALAELERGRGYTWDSEVSMLLGGRSGATKTVRVVRGSAVSSVSLPGR